MRHAAAHLEGRISGKICDGQQGRWLGRGRDDERQLRLSPLFVRTTDPTVPASESIQLLQKGRGEEGTRRV